jgi:hypothetical protein
MCLEVDDPMTEGTGRARALQADRRKARLAAQLRSNLKKRKRQARERGLTGDRASTMEGSIEESRLQGRPGQGR